MSGLTDPNAPSMISVDLLRWILLLPCTLITLVLVRHAVFTGPVVELTLKPTQTFGPGTTLGVLKAGLMVWTPAVLSVAVSTALAPARRVAVASIWSAIVCVVWVVIGGLAFGIALLPEGHFPVWFRTTDFFIAHCLLVLPLTLQVLITAGMIALIGRRQSLR